MVVDFCSHQNCLSTVYKTLLPVLSTSVLPVILLVLFLLDSHKHIDVEASHQSRLKNLVVSKVNRKYRTLIKQAR